MEKPIVEYVANGTRSANTESDVTKNPVPDPKMAELEKLMTQLQAGQITMLEYQKAVENLNNPAGDVFSAGGLK